MPAQSWRRGGGRSFNGLPNTKRSVVTMWVEYPPWVGVVRSISVLL